MAILSSSLKDSNLKKAQNAVVKKSADESTIYAHADENTNAANIISNRNNDNFEYGGSFSDGDEENEL